MATKEELEYHGKLVNEMAKAAWESYSDAVGGTSFIGDELPAWGQLDSRQKKGWRASVQAAAIVLGSEIETVIKANKDMEMSQIAGIMGE